MSTIKLYKEIRDLKKSVDRLHTTGVISDTQRVKHYLIFAANLYNITQVQEAEEVLDEIAYVYDEYLDDMFYKDLKRSAKARIDILRVGEANAKLVDEGGDSEFIDVIHLLLSHMEQFKNPKLERLDACFRSYQQQIIKEMKDGSSETTIKIPIEKPNKGTIQ